MSRYKANMHVQPRNIGELTHTLLDQNGVPIGMLRAGAVKRIMSYVALGEAAEDGNFEEVLNLSREINGGKHSD